MIKNLRVRTEPDIRQKKEFLTPPHKQDSGRKRFFTQNFKQSSFIHNRFSLGHLNEESSRKKIVVQEEELQKPYFKLPKIVKHPLKEQQLDTISIKVVKMKKLFYDPFGCSKSSKLEKVRIRKKIMGIGRQNQVILEQYALKNRKVKVMEQMSKDEEQKYKMKIYGC